MFLVRDMANIAPEMLWSACLNGGLVFDFPFLKNGNGSATVYMPAIQSGGTRTKPRVFWCSEKFKRGHTSLYSVLVASSLKADSVWREVGRAAWCTAVAVVQHMPHRERLS